MAGRWHKPDFEKARDRIWAYCRDNAVKRFRKFALTKSDLGKMMHDTCYYCAAPPRNRLSDKNFIYFYQGIDRKDNERGYTKENCVPCCGECNAIKGNRLGHDEMIIVAQALKAFRLKRRKAP